ncbi:hypothetical protein BSKO_00409 [Bryopsis sp. KO-2023]|nr:hypothetical protein BSKO_00409 [Bryopsis sp. KO-2023]
MSYPSVRYGEYPARVPDQRAAHQVAEFLKEIPAARCINADRNLFELPVQLRDGRVIGLQISLPPRFPDVPPVIVVSQDFPHQHVDSNRRVQLQSLNHWHPGLTLKKVAADAQALLVGQNPTPGQPAPGGGPAAGGVGEIANILEGYSNEDLGTCIVDTGAYKQLFERVVQTLQPEKMNEEVRKRNEAAAKANLSREGEINELINQIAIIKSSEYAYARKDFEEKVAKHMSIAGKISIPALINSLQESGKEVDDESEKLDDKFRNGEVELEDFARDYCKMRMEFYTRELKAQAATQLHM